jgi:hypothetical protein
VGVGAAGTEPWAWLYDQASNRNLRLHAGESFKAAGLEAKVREIDPDYSFMTFERNGHVWRLKLGQNLDEIEKLADEPLAETSPVTTERPVEAPKPAAPPAPSHTEPGRPAAASGERASAS